MLKIKKRSEKQEEFSSKKIEQSIVNAGAEEKAAREITSKVMHKEGLTTSDVRKLVTERLTSHDSKLGQNYETYKKPVPAKG